MKNLKEDFVKDRNSVFEYIKSNEEYIKERGLNEFDRLELFAWFLLNSHNTISSIATQCGHLSKSTYDAKTYIDDINETQKEHYEGMIKEDIYDIYDDDDYDAGEKLMYIMEYVDSLSDY